MGVVSLVIISSCFHVVTFVVSTPVQRLCPVGQFLDEITGLCDPCSEICYLAHVQGTTELCQKHCPEYVAVSMNDVRAGGKTTKKQELCPPGTYLDQNVLRCESCALLCEEKSPKGEDCTNKCPGFLKERSSVLPRHSMGVLLWTLVGALSVIFVTMVIVIVIKFGGIRSAPSRQVGRREVAPFIVPYIRLGEEKPQQRVNQWLTLLHESPPETDSCHGSKASLIYNPVKTKT